MVCSVGYGKDSNGEMDWKHYVTRCLDALIDHGMDEYGPVKTPMLMSVIDIETLVGCINY